MKLLYLIFTISQAEGWGSEFGTNNEVIFLFRQSSCSLYVYVVAIDSNGLRVVQYFQLPSSWSYQRLKILGVSTKI